MESGNTRLAATNAKRISHVSACAQRHAQLQQLADSKKDASVYSPRFTKCSHPRRELKDKCLDIPIMRSVAPTASLRSRHVSAAKNLQSVCTNLARQYGKSKLSTNQSQNATIITNVHQNTSRNPSGSQGSAIQKFSRVPSGHG